MSMAVTHTSDKPHQRDGTPPYVQTTEVNRLLLFDMCRRDSDESERVNETYSPVIAQGIALETLSTLRDKLHIFGNCNDLNPS